MQPSRTSYCRPQNWLDFRRSTSYDEAAIPRHRCGHIACGTYCSLSAQTPTAWVSTTGAAAATANDVNSTRTQRTSYYGNAFGRQTQRQRALGKALKQQDLQGRELGAWRAGATTYQKQQQPMTSTMKPKSSDRSLTGGHCGTELGGLEPLVEVKLIGNDPACLNLSNDAFPVLSAADLKEKLKDNPKYLMEQMCQRLQKYDRSSRGIVTAAIFSNLLRSLGANPPLPEISEVLHYCVLTHDGFVVYKPLIIAITPHKVPGYKDSVKDHLCPPEVWKQDIYLPACSERLAQQHPFQSISPRQPHAESKTIAAQLSAIEASSSILPDNTVSNLDTEKTPPWKYEILRDPLCSPAWTPQKSDAVRRLFAMWDRCLINDDKLKEHIKLLGLPITRETESLLSLHSESRSVPFGKFLQTLQIDDLSNFRKNRGVTQYLASQLEEPAPSRFSARRLFEARTDPLTWGCRPPLSVVSDNTNTAAGYTSMRWTSDRHRIPDEDALSRRDECCPNDDVDDETLRYRQIRQLIVDAEAGRVLPSFVRGTLDRLGITITMEVDRLLQEQESAGSIPYTRLMAAVARAPGWKQTKNCDDCVTKAVGQNKQLRFALD